MDTSVADTVNQDVATHKATADGLKQDDALRGDAKVTSKSDVKSAGGADATVKKTACKKHPDNSEKKKNLKKAHKKAKKAASSESDSSSTDSSSSSSESEDEAESESDSESSESEDEKQKRKAKKAKAKAKRLKEKAKKARAQKKKAAAEEESSESEEDSSEEEKGNKKNAKAKAKARKVAKRKAREEEESDDIELEEDPNSAKLRAMKLQLARLGLDTARGQPARRGRGGLSGISRRDLGLEDPLARVKAKQAEKTKAKAKKKARGSKVAFKRVDQLWDQSIHNYKLTETVDDPGVEEFDQYIFTVRRKFDWEHKYQETLVDIRSKPLKEALKHIMSEVKGVSLVQETPHIDPNMLFLYLEETRAYMKELKEASKSEKKRKARKAAAAKASHLKVLIKYLDKDYAETKKTLYPLLENKMITFDLLWALYKPNTIAYCATYGDHDQPRAFKIDYATKDSHFMKGVWYSIEGRYLEYDGKSFGMGTMHTDVMSFTGSRKISSLDCYPLQYHKDPEGVRTTLIERGKKFAALKGMNYRYHKGMAYTKRKRQILKININGRVMIDPAIHRRINPNYPISTVKPKDDADVYEPSDAGSEDDSCRCGGHSSSDDAEGDRNTPSSSEDTKQQRKKFKVVKDEQGQHHLVEIEIDDNGEEIIQKEKLGALGQGVEEAFSDEELLIASPVVLGFAFSEKLWLEFTVSGISDVVWNEGAFDSLVLPDNQKSIVKALVSSHAFHPSRSIDDIIVGKGKGLVAVLHGPPGTGKTLTAEGIADLLKCPLYMVSAGDLGTDPRTLEKELQNILGVYPSPFSLPPSANIDPRHRTQLGRSPPPGRSGRLPRKALNPRHPPQRPRQHLPPPSRVLPRHSLPHHKPRRDVR